MYISWKTDHYYNIADDARELWLLLEQFYWHALKCIPLVGVAPPGQDFKGFPIAGFLHARDVHP